MFFHWKNDASFANEFHIEMLESVKIHNQKAIKTARSVMNAKNGHHRAEDPGIY